MCYQVSIDISVYSTCFNNEFSDLRYVKTEPHVLTLMVDMHAFASTGGQVMTAVKTLTTVLMLRASTELPVLTELVALVADAHLERLDFCAI